MLMSNSVSITCFVCYICCIICHKPALKYGMNWKSILFLLSKWNGIKIYVKNWELINYISIFIACLVFRKIISNLEEIRDMPGKAKNHIRFIRKSFIYTVCRCQVQVLEKRSFSTKTFHPGLRSCLKSHHDELSVLLLLPSNSDFCWSDWRRPSGHRGRHTCDHDLA